MGLQRGRLLFESGLCLGYLFLSFVESGLQCLRESLTFVVDSVAAFFDLRLRNAVPVIFAGVVTAGIVVFLITYGVVAVA